MRRQLGRHRGAGSPAARGRDTTGIPGRARPTSQPRQSPTSPSGRPSPTVPSSAGPLPSESSAGVPVGPSWADHRLGRHGPARARPLAHTTINRPAAHWATDPPTRHAAPAAAGGRRPLADDSEAAGPAGLGRAGRSSPARSGGPDMVITVLAPRHYSGCARGILRPLGLITPGPPGNPLNPAPGVITQLWTFSQPSTCCVICP